MLSGFELIILLSIIMDSFFAILNAVNSFIWHYAALLIIITIGLYLTVKSRFLQFHTIFSIRKTIAESVANSKGNAYGTHPIKLYFASAGGMVGLGNIVFVMGTVAIGGPGSLVWLWCASLVGMLMKYSEIYLGIKYRQRSGNSFNGGPMYYLKAAFGNRILPLIAAFLLCIYGVEIFQFHVIVHSISDTFHLNKMFVILMLIALLFASALGGVKRLANVCTIIMPPFMLCYIIIALYIIIANASLLPETLSFIWSSAFGWRAPVGAFAGSTLMVAAHYGASRAVYSGDIGIGYDSIVQSETRVKDPAKHAKLGILALFTDSVICTLSILIVLLTGVWSSGAEHHEIIGGAIGMYLPFAKYFMALLFFFAGFTTLIAFLVVGIKCAEYISAKYGKKFYILYAILAFIIFSYQEQKHVVLVMEFSGALLMIINMLGVFKLRKQIKFR